MHSAMSLLPFIVKFWTAEVWARLLILRHPGSFISASSLLMTVRDTAVWGSEAQVMSRICIGELCLPPGVLSFCLPSVSGPPAFCCRWQHRRTEDRQQDDEGPTVSLGHSAGWVSRRPGEGSSFYLSLCLTPAIGWPVPNLFQVSTLLAWASNSRRGCQQEKLWLLVFLPWVGSLCL